MYLHLANEVQVCVDARKQRGLPAEVAGCCGYDAFEGVRDGEDVEVEGARGYFDGLALAMERCEGVIDVFEEDMGTAEVGGSELGGLVGRGCRENVCAGLTACVPLVVGIHTFYWELQG